MKINKYSSSEVLDAYLMKMYKKGAGAYSIPLPNPSKVIRVIEEGTGEAAGEAARVAPKVTQPPPKPTPPPPPKPVSAPAPTPISKEVIKEILELPAAKLIMESRRESQTAMNQAVAIIKRLSVAERGSEEAKVLAKQFEDKFAESKQALQDYFMGRERLKSILVGEDLTSETFDIIFNVERDASLIKAFEGLDLKYKSLITTAPEVINAPSPTAGKAVAQSTQDAIQQNRAALAQAGVTLTAEGAKATDDVIVLSELNFYKGAYETLLQTLGPDSEIVKMLKQLSETSAKQLEEAKRLAAATAPEAAATTEATAETVGKQAAAEGSQAATKATKEAGTKNEPGIFHKLWETKRTSVGGQMMGAAGTGLSWMAGKAAIGGVYLAGLFAVLLGGGLAARAAYLWYIRRHQDEVTQAINNTSDALTTAQERLQALQFQPDTYGEKITQRLISEITTLLPMLGMVASPEAIEANQDIIETVFKNKLGTIDSLVKNFLENQEIIQGNLASPVGWPEALTAVKDLDNAITDIKLLLLDISEEAPESQEPQVPAGEEIKAPVGKPAEPTPQAKPTILRMYGERIDISNTSPGFRASVPAMVEKVLNTPEGLAFVDPKNIWGGWLRKSGDPQADYLRYLKYLYQNQIFSRHLLRKFIRDNLPRIGRRRFSGWKEAVKFYKHHLNRYARQLFIRNLHKNSQDKQKSTISFDCGMQKNADQVSNQYIQDALKNLGDQYAKSYFSDLKGLYDEKAARTDADVKKLYQLHSETGPDLVGEAHPKSITVSNAMGRGGLVENIVEQHRHNEGVALSMPSGNYRSKHAWVVHSLVKLANTIDDQGLNQVSDLIDTALNEIVSLNQTVHTK